MMNPEIKEQWCQALESGAFEQGKTYLYKFYYEKQEKLYCSLGVLCEIRGLKKSIGFVNYDTNPINCFIYYNYHFSDGYEDDSRISSSFLNEMNITSKDADTLTGMNDNGKSFAEIAKYIRENM